MQLSAKQDGPIANEKGATWKSRKGSINNRLTTELIAVDQLGKAPLELNLGSDKLQVRTICKEIAVRDRGGSSLG
jgi:hypothetical protein